jgi:hypothetical protein
MICEHQRQLWQQQHLLLQQKLGQFSHNPKSEKKIILNDQFLINLYLFFFYWSQVFAKK